MSPIFPQFCLPAILKWRMCTGSLPLSPISMASRRASGSWSPSSRMWLGEMPAFGGRPFARQPHLVGVANQVERGISAGRCGGGKKRKMGVVVQIKESGGSEEPVLLEDALGCGWPDRPHRRNLAVFDRHVALIPGAASPIHDVGMNNDNVVQRLS